jgi:hypothetical protein
MTQLATDALFSKATIGTIDTDVAASLDGPGLATEALHLCATLRTAAGEPMTAARFDG